ncbi:MAG TPA: S9 family peptidase [Candidatus Koribacter sp.]|jgi:dipeptidyl aminopeptidase/acylaminoacyl peptidase
MRVPKVLWKISSCTALFAATGALAQIGGMPQRALTDPQSLSSPTNAAAKPVPVDDLFYTRRVQGSSWSPDGKQIVFTTNLTGRLNLWKVSANGGWPLQLSQSDDRQINALWSPDGKSIAYLQDVGGNEQYQIYLVPSDGGDATDLTHNPEYRYTWMRFSRDGKSLGFSMKKKTASSLDIAVMDIASRQVRNLTNEQSPKHYWVFGGFSFDNRAIFATRHNINFADSSVYRIDIGSGKVEELTPHTGDINFGFNAVSHDDKRLLISSNQKNGIDNVALLDLATKQLTWITQSQWEGSGAAFSPDGRHFTYVVNEDGRSTTYVAALGGKSQKLDFPDGLTSPAGTPDSYSPSGDRILLGHEGSRHPSDLWVYDVATGKSHQLTFSALASLNPANLPPSSIVHYKSFDGTIISAILWMPSNLKRDGNNPAVVIPHGGPTGQTDDSFFPAATALASRGYICIAPNVRGSTGYGAQFQKANIKDLGGGDLQDEVYATKFLVATGFVDAKKIGITGGSYGGAMTLMAVGKTPDVWAAAVENYGVVSWLSMLEHSDAFLRSYVLGLEGDPVKDRAVYDSNSAITYLPNAKAPLLVLQGENDVRVPKEEAEQVVNIYKAHGKIVDAKYYPLEGHGYTRRENQIDAVKRAVAWFDKYLKGDAANVAAN